MSSSRSDASSVRNSLPVFPIFGFLVVQHLFLPWCVSLLCHPMFLTPSIRVLSVFSTQLARTQDASQRHPYKCPRPGNPSLIDKNASILRLHLAKSGWVRAACRNSCSGSDQKKEGDFFDYYLFVRPPLKLTYSLRPLSEWASSQGNALGNSVLIGVRIHLYLFTF